MPLLCNNPRCRALGQHVEGCADETCRGCLPRQAADGVRLCHVCGRRLAEDITQAGRLWSELGLVLVSGDRPGERVSGASIDKSLSLNERAMKARTRIWETLAAWAKLVVDERGVTRPLDQVGALASFLRRHAEWLGAHELAGHAAEEIAELAHGQARRIAYPTGARVFEVAPCPLNDAAGAPCAGIIKAILRQTDALLPSELVCDVDEAHRWDSTTWVRLGRQLHAARTAEGSPA
jgi:hypothetical protein